MLTLLKRGWSFIFAIFSLMVFPQETLRLVLEDDPSYWYGELALPSPEGTYVLAKNGHTESIDPDLPRAKPLASVPFRRKKAITQPLPEVRSQSYALFLVDGDQRVSRGRSAKTNAGEIFPVERLRVQAGAEKGISAWLLLLLIGLLAVLGGGVGYYFSDEIDLLADNKQ